MKKTTLILLGIFAFFALSCNQPTRAQVQTADNEIEVVCEKNETEELFCEIVYKNSETEYRCTNDLNIFSLWRNTERGISLVSFSQIDRLSMHPDSLAIPDLSDWEWEKYRFFELDAEYRRRFLERTGVSETDSLFVFDYTNDILLTFSVRELSVFAQLQFWSDRPSRSPHSPHPHSQYHFHIGFGIHNDDLSAIRSPSLVYVGKMHPFVRNGMQQIVWERIDLDDFPMERAQLITVDSVFFALDPAISFVHNSVRGEAHTFEWKHFRFFIQDWRLPNEWEVEYAGRNWIIERVHLLVFNQKNDELVIEEFFCSDERHVLFERNIPRWIGGRWIGYLFQNKPPVVADFSDFIGGDARYIFLDPTMGDFLILCDNRY